MSTDKKAEGERVFRRVVMWLKRPVKIGGVPLSRDTQFIVAGLVLVLCYSVVRLLLGLFSIVISPPGVFDVVDLIFFLGICLAVIGYIIYWADSIKRNK
jgi:hypothetical protein